MKLKIIFSKKKIMIEIAKKIKLKKIIQNQPRNILLWLLNIAISNLYIIQVIYFFQECNLEKAKYYYLLSVDQGNKKSVHNLGLMYLKEGNEEKALHYFNLAKN